MDLWQLGGCLFAAAVPQSITTVPKSSQPNTTSKGAIYNRTISTGTSENTFKSHENIMKIMCYDPHSQVGMIIQVVFKVLHEVVARNPQGEMEVGPTAPFGNSDKMRAMKKRAPSCLGDYCMLPSYIWDNYHQQWDKLPSTSINNSCYPGLQGSDQSILLI